MHWRRCGYINRHNVADRDGSKDVRNWRQQICSCLKSILWSGYASKRKCIRALLKLSDHSSIREVSSVHIIEKHVTITSWTQSWAAQGQDIMTANADLVSLPQNIHSISFHTSGQISIPESGTILQASAIIFLYAGNSHPSYRCSNKGLLYPREVYLLCEFSLPFCILTRSFYYLIR